MLGTIRTQNMWSPIRQYCPVPVAVVRENIMSGKIIVAKSRKNWNVWKHFVSFAADERQAFQDVG